MRFFKSQSTVNRERNLRKNGEVKSYMQADLQKSNGLNDFGTGPAMSYIDPQPRGVNDVKKEGNKSCFTGQRYS